MDLRTQFDFADEIAVCAFPYILAFTADSIEVRLVINGNLIQAMVMPRLVLISSKSDVFFATTAPEFFTLRPTDRGRNERLDKDISPPSSPHCKSSVSCCKRHAHSPFHLFCLLFFLSLLSAHCSSFRR